MTLELVSTVALVLSIYLIVIGVSAYMNVEPTTSSTSVTPQKPSALALLVTYLKALDHPLIKIGSGVAGIAILFYFIVWPLINKSSSAPAVGKAFKHFEFI